MIWFTSDTHFGHDNIRKYECRPYDSVEAMDEDLIQCWNECIGKKDQIYHLGDFAFRNHEAIFRRLNGGKYLISGNHDDGKTFRLPWGFRKEAYTLKVGGDAFYLHHYGCRVWNKSCHGSYHLHGHSHGHLPPHGRSMDVGVDNIVKLFGKYRPISLEEVVGMLSSEPYSAGEDR